MARYDKSHKEKSRAALIEGAAALFRKRGYDGVGIDELCAAAGLTRGAFYAHFRSKRELLQAVLSSSHDLLRRLQERPAKHPQSLVTGGAKVAQDYLNTHNRKTVLAGCSLASLAMDTVRADAPTQAAYAAVTEKIVGEFCRGNPALSKDEARVAVALCVGGLLLGAACGADPSGDKLANAARKHVARLLRKSP